MAYQAAVNASPVILLAKVGLVDVLRLLSDPVFVPKAVAQEIQQRGTADPAVQALAQAGWLVAVDPGPPPPTITAWNLGSGESAVLTYALANPGTEVLIDDWAARRCASALGIPRRGTVALVILAKQQGKIATARPVLEQLRQMGMYLSDRVMNQALALVGE